MTQPTRYPAVFGTTDRGGLGGYERHDALPPERVLDAARAVWESSGKVRGWVSMVLAITKDDGWTYDPARVEAEQIERFSRDVAAFERTFADERCSCRRVTRTTGALVEFLRDPRCPIHANRR